MFDKRLLATVPESKPWIKATVLWQWLSLITAIFAAFAFGYSIQSAYDPQGSHVFWPYFGILIVALLFRAYTAQKATETSYKASVDVKHRLRTLMYQKINSMPIGQSQTLNTASIMQTAAEGVEQIEVFFGRYLPQLFYSLLAPLTLFAILMFINFPAAVVLFICVPLIPISIVAITKIAKRLLAQYWGFYINLGSGFLDNLQGLTTLKIYQDDAYKNQKMNAEAEHFRKITMRVLTMQLNSISLMDLLAYGGAAVGIFMALDQFHKGALDLAGVIIFILLSAEFFIPLRLLGSFFHVAMNGQAAAKNIFQLLDTAVEQQGNGVCTGLENSFPIEIQQLSFAYSSEKTALQSVDLAIAAQKLTVIVGSSGCGKSTLAHLLMRFYRPQSGQILFNGQDLQHFDSAYLYRHIALVSHHSYFFKGPLRDNLLMAQPTASDADLQAVLEQVDLWNFVAENHGLDLALLSNASNLSGGQIQRLALARALLHDASLYIFDEATSNIDTESEAIVLKLIHQLKQHKTIIMISHRLANAVDADQIYVLQQGQVLETGNHQTLMTQNAVYAQMFQQQKDLEKIRHLYQGAPHE